MAIPSLWSKLDGPSDVTSPTLGVGGSIVGSPTFESAKYNNGILSIENSQGCIFPTDPNDINISKGTIEFWAKMKYESSYYISKHCFFDFRDIAYSGIQIFFHAIDTVRLYVWGAGGLAVTLDMPVSWGVNALRYFKVMWDRKGIDIGSGKTVMVEMNHAVIGSSKAKWDSENVAVNLAIGMLCNGEWHSDTVIDDLRTYPICNIRTGIPTDLLCEQKTNPVNVTDPNPEFSAIYRGAPQA